MAIIADKIATFSIIISIVTKWAVCMLHFTAYHVFWVFLSGAGTTIKLRWVNTFRIMQCDSSSSSEVTDFGPCMAISVLLLQLGQSHEELVPPLDPGWQMLLVTGNQLAHLLWTSQREMLGINNRSLPKQHCFYVVTYRYGLLSFSNIRGGFLGRRSWSTPWNVSAHHWFQHTFFVCYSFARQIISEPSLNCTTWSTTDKRIGMSELKHQRSEGWLQ